MQSLWRPLLTSVAIALSFCYLPPSQTQAVMAGARPDYGVIYYIPGADVADAAVTQQLQTIKSQGYRHINLSSWVWTLPKAGSPLRRRVDLILNWCDQNDLGVWLLHNIQYGTPEYGDFEAAIKDPAAYAHPVVVDWIEALSGHHCVRGVQLGNEVGPAMPADAAKVPLYTHAFSAWLRARYVSIELLNTAWGSHFAAFDKVGLPAPDAPGRIDLQRFAQAQFGHFYGTIFKTLFKPVLGAALGYTTKTSSDPYLYRAFPEATVLGWDDMVANHPLWTLCVLADCDPRPPFNNEMHLYHDKFAYWPSIELTRYRYFTDALSNQWMSSSFAWGSWHNPDIATIHAATPRTLNDIERLAAPLRRFNAARRAARIGVLVTEPLLAESSRNISARPVLKPGEAIAANAPALARTAVPLEDAYTALAATGRPWRYVLDLDLNSQARQLEALIIPAQRQIPLATLRQVLALPRSVRLEWVGAWPLETEYGQPLPIELLAALQHRCRQSAALEQAAAPYVDSTLAPTYRTPAIVAYNWWSPEKGSFTFGVSYPRLEARRVAGAQGDTFVALINHTRETITLSVLAALPWHKMRQRTFDLTAQPPVELTPVPDGPIVLGPFDVRLYRYK